jgi:DNA-binding MarR family transcriptional regulator
MKEDEMVKDASRLANLTFTLLSTCQQKEAILAEQYGLTQSEFRCLKMFDKKETINNKNIAKRMNLSASRLTRIIDGLVAKGYTEREINPSDRRNMDVNLSKKGVNLVQKLDLAYINIHKELLEDIEESQHKPLIYAMTNLLGAMERWLAK